MHGSYLGPDYAQVEIEKRLTKLGARFYVLHDSELMEKTDRAGQSKSRWVDAGRMEFGPRALGGRSIIADPRSEDMQKR